MKTGSSYVRSLSKSLGIVFGGFSQLLNPRIITANTEEEYMSNYFIDDSLVVLFIFAKGFA